jgi:hypothetical protein
MADKNTVGIVSVALGASGVAVMMWTLWQVHHHETSGSAAVESHMRSIIAQKATKNKCTESTQFSATGSIGYPVLLVGSMVAILTAFVGALSSHAPLVNTLPVPVMPTVRAMVP